MNSELQNSLMKIAASDLSSARRNNEILIGQTKLGTLKLTHSAGIYTLSTQGLNASILAQGKPAVVKPVLANSYEVVYA